MLPQFSKSLSKPRDQRGYSGTCQFLPKPTSKTFCSFPTSLLISYSYPFWSSNIPFMRLFSQQKIDNLRKHIQSSRPYQWFYERKVNLSTHSRITDHFLKSKAFRVLHFSNLWSSDLRVWKGNPHLLHALRPIS